MSVNKVILLGNLGKDPETREFENGKIVSFTLATTDKAYTNKQGQQVPEKTEWHNCVCFGHTADFVANYIRKGNKVYIEGKIRYRKYTASDNTEKWITEIMVDRLDNLTPKSDSQQPNPAPQPMSVQQQYETVYGPTAPSNDPPF